MKVRYIDESSISLTTGKIYDVLAFDGTDGYRIVDNSGEDYLYDKSSFEIIDFEPDLHIPTDSEFWDEIESRPHIKQILAKFAGNYTELEFEEDAKSLTPNEFSCVFYEWKLHSSLLRTS